MNQLNLAFVILAIWVAQCYADFPKNQFSWSEKHPNSANSLDGWKVEKNNFGQQIFGLYHGHNWNRVPSLLQENLVDSINEYFSAILNELDNEKEKSNKLDDKLFEEIKENLVILLTEQDELIQNYRSGPGGSYADALVVIVTRQFIISVNVGKNKAVAIDAHRVMTISTPTLDPRDKIGLRENKDVYHPNVMVDIVPRVYKDEKDGSEHEIRFLVLQVEPIAESVSNSELSKIVLEGTKRLAKFTSNEHIFQNIINAIKSTAATRIQPLYENKNKDRTVILVKLQELNSRNSKFPSFE